MSYLPLLSATIPISWLAFACSSPAFFPPGGPAGRAPRPNAPARLRNCQPRLRKGVHLSQEFREFAISVEPLQLRTHASALGRGGSFHIYISNEGLLHGCIKQSFRIKIAIDIFISEDYMLG